MCTKTHAQSRMPLQRHTRPLKATPSAASRARPVSHARHNELLVLGYLIPIPT